VRISGPGKVMTSSTSNTHSCCSVLQRVLQYVLQCVTVSVCRLLPAYSDVAVCRRVC